MMPIWNGRDDSVLNTWTTSKKFLAGRPISTSAPSWGERGGDRDVCATEIAQIRARFDQWRSEVRMRLGLAER